VAQTPPKNRGNAGKGRPKGATNLATRAIKEIAAGLLEDEEYQASLKIRLKAGKAPHMETLLHHYAYGKPVERIEDVTPPRRPHQDAPKAALLERLALLC
jgi:hypothetical protein